MPLYNKVIEDQEETESWMEKEDYNFLERAKTFGNAVTAQMNLTPNQTIQNFFGDGNIIEAYKNKTIGKEYIDKEIDKLTAAWNLLPDGGKRGVISTLQAGSEIAGNVWEDLKTVEGAERYDPIDWITSGLAHTIDFAGDKLDKYVAKPTAYAVHNWAGIDKRGADLTGLAAEMYLTRRAFKTVPKAINLINKGIDSKQAHNLAFKAGQYVDEALGPFKPPSQRTITIKDYATILDQTWQMPSQEIQRIVKLAKQPGINSFTLAKRLNEQQGVIKEYLKKFGHGKTPDLKNILDPFDQPTYKGSSLDLNTAVHPTTYDGINTINTLLNKHGGFKGARLNLKSYDLKGNLDKRIAATVYFTPFGKGGNFQAIAKRKKSIVYQIFGTDLERMGFSPITEKMGTSPSVQAHHKKTPIKAIVPGFEGIVKESPKYHRFTKLFFDEMLALGDMPENITGVLGHTARDIDSPHSLSHLFTRYMMGEDGKLFWTQDKLDQIVVYDNEGNAIGTKNDDLREKFMLEQIDLLKDNLKVLENATEQYEILFKQGIQDPATVIQYFEEQLPNLDKEYIRAFAPKILEKFIDEVKAEEAATVQANPITTSTRNEIIDNIFRRENVKQWRLWDVPVRKARMKEITDGWSFEQIEAFIDAGWLDDEQLHELFNPPPESWEDLFPD